MTRPQFDVMVTTACNASCAFCVQEATFKSGRCTDDCFVAALERHFADFYEAGGRRVVITGGEPLLVPRRVLKVLAVLASYKDLEVKAVYTNGHRLLNQIADSESGTIAQALRRAGLGCTNLSVHHFDKSMNDRIMGLPDAPGASAIASHLREIGLSFRFNLTLQKGGIETLSELTEYLRWAIALGVSDVYVRELFDLRLASPRTDTDRRPVEYSALHRVPIVPLVEALALNPEFSLLAEAREPLRDKTEWDFRHQVTGRHVYLSRLTVGTESARGLPYIVLMPDGDIYRGWLGPQHQLPVAEFRIEGIAARP